MSPDDPGVGPRLSPAFASSASADDWELRDRYSVVRARSIGLAAPLSPEDMTAQSMPDASPTKWHLAHTTWFFETFVLLPRTGGAPFDPAYGLLFNSYYEAAGPRTPRNARGLITRPGVAAVMDYRAHVDAQMVRLLAGGVDEAGAALVQLGLVHEEQHQELLLTDVLHLLSHNPIDPAYAQAEPTLGAAPARMTWTDHAGGVVEVGADEDSFAFDNETPRHRALLQPHRLANRLVTNGEWLEFMEEGGIGAQSFGCRTAGLR